jgi:hypothetical protein
MDRYVLSEGVVERAADNPPLAWARVDGRYTSLQGQAVEPGVRVYENMPPSRSWSAKASSVSPHANGM